MSEHFDAADVALAVEDAESKAQQVQEPSVKHELHCMKLDPYDDRDWACTCGAEEKAQQAQEPVAWVAESVLDKQFVNGRPRRVWYECVDGVGMAIYAAPQPTPEVERDAEIATARYENVLKYGTSHPEMYETELDCVKRQIALLREALEGAYDYVEEAINRHMQEYGENYRKNRLDYMRAVKASMDAALAATEEKK